MKLRKVLAALAASAIAVSAMAIGVGAASVVVPSDAPHLHGSGTGLIVIPLKIDEGNADNKYPTLFDLDYSKIATIEFIVTTGDGEFDFDPEDDNNMGGSIGMSSNTDGWNQYNWWGLSETPNEAEPVIAEILGEQRYRLAVTLPADKRMDETPEYAQMFLQEWGSSFNGLYLESAALYDDAGSVLVSFDSKGVPSIANVLEAGGAAADASAGGANSAAGAGDTTVSVSSDSKGNADTGIEGVAVIAGIALVAGGAVLVTRRRK